MNRFNIDMNRFNSSSGQFESFQVFLDLHQSSFHLPYLGFCFSVSESIHCSIESIQLAIFVRILSLLTHYYIYSFSHNSKNIESFASILFRSQKLIAHTFFKNKHFFLESRCLWVCIFSRVLVGIVSWFSQEDWLGLIKASKEVNNLIPPLKDLVVFLTVLRIEGGSFAERSIEDMSEEFEGVQGKFKDPKIQ